MTTFVRVSSRGLSQVKMRQPCRSRLLLLLLCTMIAITPIPGVRHANVPMDKTNTEIGRNIGLQAAPPTTLTIGRVAAIYYPAPGHIDIRTAQATKGFRGERSVIR